MKLMFFPNNISVNMPFILKHAHTSVFLLTLYFAYGNTTKYN